jgi:hypothetical protein
LWKKLAALYRETAGLVIAKSKPIDEEGRDVQRCAGGKKQWEEGANREKQTLFPPTFPFIFFFLPKLQFTFLATRFYTSLPSPLFHSTIQSVLLATYSSWTTLQMEASKLHSNITNNCQKNGNSS